jgi:hypothetical protein
MVVIRAACIIILLFIAGRGLNKYLINQEIKSKIYRFRIRLILFIDSTENSGRKH